tara:strand:+ start:6615 stop:6983 length:369 start_codon:yes stop_codon:yes gene_type:complete
MANKKAVKTNKIDNKNEKAKTAKTAKAVKAVKEKDKTNKIDNKNEKDKKKELKKEERQKRIDDNREWLMTKPRPLRDILQAMAVVFKNGPSFFVSGKMFIKSLMTSGGIGIALFALFKWLTR